METLASEISRLLSDSLSSEKALVASSTVGLDRLSRSPEFPFALLAIVRGHENQWLKLAASTYLKNFTRRYMAGSSYSSELHHEFRNQLAQASLQAEDAVLKVLVEAFRIVVADDFIKNNSWPDLIPELKSVIQSSKLISQNKYSQWDTINALVVLQAVLRPFQYFMNPKVPREPVPQQLESIAENILVNLQAPFHHHVDKVLSSQASIQIDSEQILLIICKCMYFSVRSYMPSGVRIILPAFCEDLFRILNSLSLTGASPGDGYLLRVKTAKRSLLIFRALVTRHWKHVDKLLSNIFKCALKISEHSSNVSKLDLFSERVVSLSFDVISDILETSPCWRLVSPYFTSLLDSAIFPALVMNSKDICEWEEDPDEYLRKNLPSDLEEVSGWAEELFTARKSAIYLLSVISMSKDPSVGSTSSKRKKSDKRKGRYRLIGELVVIPFLSKFSMPVDVANTPPNILHDYYGVLMAYGGLRDFLMEKGLEYTSTLIRNRVLPLYSSSAFSPFLVATANWIIGELACCLPQAMSADIFSSLTKALNMQDVHGINCYPARASAAGAIVALLEIDYVPSNWQSLLQALVERMDTTDENESSLLLQLLGNVVNAAQDKVAVHVPYIVTRIANAISKHLPPAPEPWPQVVECGFAALSTMAQTWDNAADDFKEKDSINWSSARATIARTFSNLLQWAWLRQTQQTERTLPPPSCINDASTLFGFLMRCITAKDEAIELRLMELLAVWVELIAAWHAWKEAEDLAIFTSIQEVVDFHRRCDFTSIFMRRIPCQGSSCSSSIIEGIAAFVCEAITAYPPATWRACSSVHLLLHVPRFLPETEGIKQLMAVAFTEAAFSRFCSIRGKPLGLWKPLLLVIASCYICYPDIVAQVLEKKDVAGFTNWAHALAHVSASSFEPEFSSESEIKLAVISLAKVVEQLLGITPSSSRNVVLEECFRSLMEACIRLKEVQNADSDATDEEASDEDIDDDDNGNGDDDIDDEDSEDEEKEETEEEFLDRYAKAAEAIDSEIVVEGVADDEVQELELGFFDEVDVPQIVVPLIERHHQVLMQTEIFPPDLVHRILEAFPEYSSFFQASVGKLLNAPGL